MVGPALQDLPHRTCQGHEVSRGQAQKQMDWQKQETCDLF